MYSGLKPGFKKGENNIIPLHNNIIMRMKK
jgi:hypothetical protein